MKITVICGTMVQGCTYHIKESFLSGLRKGNEITEFYLPRDLNEFCCGCKVCVLKEEAGCPHAGQVMPIWNAMLDADLIVFAYPTYALRAPASMKSLLDHLCAHWMVHRPDRRMFGKHAVVLTNALGMFYRAALKDVSTSLQWLGVSSVKTRGSALMSGIIWEELPQKRRAKIERRFRRLAARYQKVRSARMSWKVKTLFFISKMLHRMTLKMPGEVSADNRHYIENGWIKAKRFR